MNQGKYIFAQLTEFLPRRVFDRIFKKHDGNKYVRSFTCWNQMLCMVFGQLTSRESMRDLMLSLEAHRSKYYHLGFGKSISRRNLGKANEKRSSKIFEEFAAVLIEQARKSYYRNDFEIDVEGNVYALDSTTIDLCLNVFWWAEFRKAKGGIKIHTLYDVKTSIPSFLHISNASLHDVNVMDIIPFQMGDFYVFDKAYIDFERLYKLHDKEAFFVTRAKDNMRFKRMYSNPTDKTAGVKYDQIGRLEGYYSRKAFPDKLRRVKYYDEETQKELVFLTNNTELDASEIALLYKKRWEVELFFKWMKKHLKIKSFWGTTLNAVKIQIYCAIIAYCLVAIIANTLKVERRIYEILQILSISLLDKTPVREILTKHDYKDVNELKNKQLKINGL
ncbi:IS4 family transposase [Joostella atrarenae]|uniref:IS4 family transposase n=1 Tax=Joostella atrarenae TaxID=679257 RepID=A0ABS9J7E7_9FLAO|nr:IS4 family transposase [Joostella atrarenae]MCF8716344.1 IS4 family transposase [Joostella atrarenae]